MHTHFINYDGQPLAEVVITDPSPATLAIVEMVEFWSGGEWALHRAAGDYEKAFCSVLAMFLLTQRREPKDDEGWLPLDGTHGIQLQKYYHYDFDEDLIEIS